jgi:polyisoprenoid-binding protein YceI
MKQRRNVIIAVLAIIFIIAAILIARDWVLPTFAGVSVTGVPTRVDSFADLKTKQAQTKAATATATKSALNTGTDGIVLLSYKPRGQAQQKLPYDSCIEVRGSTPTPSAPQSTPTATPAAPGPAATTAAAAAEDFVFLRIDATKSEACYQVGEIFFNEDNRFNLAVGITHSIDGEVAIDRANIANSKIGDFTININEFSSDQPRRDGIIRRRWLESDRYPYAMLTNAQIIGLPTRPYSEGETLTFQIVGDLEIHATKRSTVFNATASLTGGTLYVHAVADIKMTDFGFEPPDIAGTVRANNDARLVLNLIATDEEATKPNK